MLGHGFRPQVLQWHLAPLPSFGEKPAREGSLYSKTWRWRTPYRCLRPTCSRMSSCIGPNTIQSDLGCHGEVLERCGSPGTGSALGEHTALAAGQLCAGDVDLTAAMSCPKGSLVGLRYQLLRYGRGWPGPLLSTEAVPSWNLQEIPIPQCPFLWLDSEG